MVRYISICQCGTHYCKKVTFYFSFLQAVEACSAHKVSASSGEALLEAVLTRWVKVVEAESHEGSLLQAMSVLQAWLPIASTHKHMQLIADNIQVCMPYISLLFHDIYYLMH